MLNTYERFALGQYLSEFPEDKSFHEILDIIEKSDFDDEAYDELLVWEPFENCDGDNLAALIGALKEDLEEVFVPRNSKG